MKATFNASLEASKIINFLQTTFAKQQKSQALIAVSGGIDSALSLTLLAKALDPKQIFPVFLPYAKQDMADAQLICSWNNIPQENWQSINIESMVASFAKALGLDLAVLSSLSKAEDASLAKTRLGNIMARCRMIVLFDLAKKFNALVCGTENKSEKLLAYYTRYGDEASDLEPIASLYKTWVYQLAKDLQLPATLLEKPPSAGLWLDQTDETDFGFSYQEADQFLMKLEDEGLIDQRGIVHQEKLNLANFTQQEKKIITWVMSNQFKHQVPYRL